MAGGGRNSREEPPCENKRNCREVNWQGNLWLAAIDASPDPFYKDFKVAFSQVVIRNSKGSKTSFPGYFIDIRKISPNHQKAIERSKQNYSC